MSRQEIRDWYVTKVLEDPHRSAFEWLRDKTICVLGACGQVGSHLVTKLYEMGLPLEHILVNDSLFLGTPENLPQPLRERVDTRSHFEFVRNPPCKVDMVIFVGGKSSTPHFRNLTDVMQGMATWQAILEWCVAEKIRLIWASTSSLYKSQPSVETQRVWPGSLYELTKLMMEETAIQQALCEELVVQIGRFFSVYGVTEQHKGSLGNLYTQLLWHARKQVPFELWGQEGVFTHGEQTRDSIFAVEASRAILFLLTLPEPKPVLNDISALIYNIAQGNPTPVCDMIKQVSELGLEPIVHNKPVPDEVKNYVIHTWGNPAKLHNAGFRPLFNDHRENLAFINCALMDMDWYWSLIERVRRQAI